MVLFSQYIHGHSQLGNSFTWMTLAAPGLKKYNLDSYFPYAHETFMNYLGAKSFWFKNASAGKELFLKKYSANLTSESLLALSRKIEYDYEISHRLKAFDWEKLVLSDTKKDNLYLAGKTLYLAGKIDFFSDEIVQLIKVHDLTICHGPWNFNFSMANERIADYFSVEPDINFYTDTLNFVDSVSGTKNKVGLHIRRGDYKIWRDGKYFYEDKVWLNLVTKYIKEGKDVWIFSNDLEKNFSDLLENSGAVLSNGSYETDFTRMMCMNLLIGPPSTYSNMAFSISKHVFNNSISFECMS
jgi:hypothetical protein